MTVDIESALFRRHVERHQRDRDVDVEEHAAFQAMHVIVPFDTPVVPTCLIRERQLLDQPMFGQQVQRPIDRAVRDAGVAPSYALKDLARGQVALRPAYLVEHFRPLRCVSESFPGHRTTKRDNESQ
jgi:hypothetical protein